MTRVERLLTLSTASCCMCNHPLTMQELQEFRSRADEELHGEVHCPACCDENLMVCLECSCRYTSDSVCGECAARYYALAG